tara:strand:+ start:871 stop:2667 length:1797 start_codon:yes stop_codon:yes gene_type:complete
MLKPLGKLPAVGAPVRASREPNEPLEDASVKGVDLTEGKIAVRFSDGFQASLPLDQVELDQVEPADASVEPPPSAPAAAGPVRLLDPVADPTYEAEVRPTLATPPTAEALAADPDCRYQFIAARKDAGNALFKQGKYEWAIRTYCEGVGALTESCYPIRERMLWDYQARTPAGQCYSNAALCALKLDQPARAAALCERAQQCKPEDDDLLKVLLRHGQALHAVGELESAQEKLERGAQLAPANRPIRDELAKVKKAALQQAKNADKGLFGKVDLSSKGLTSKRDAFNEQLDATLVRSLDAMLDGKDELCLKLATPLLGHLAPEREKHRAALLQLSYCAGVACYQLQQLDDAVKHLALFFELKEGRDDLPAPPSGVPLARFYLGHACFNTGRYDNAHDVLTHYLADVAAAGPQQVLNMPDGWQGKKITEADRKASRLRHRACSGDALSDAHMMLAMYCHRAVTEGDGGGDEGTGEGGQGGDDAAARAADADRCVEHCASCVRLAGSDQQRLGSQREVARMLRSLGRQAEADEHQAAAAALELEIAEKEKAEAEKKAKEAETEFSAKDAPREEEALGEAAAGEDAAGEDAAEVQQGADGE